MVSNVSGLEICRAVIICHSEHLSAVADYKYVDVVCIGPLNQVVFINFILIYYTLTHDFGWLFFSFPFFFFFLLFYIDVSHDKIPLNINMHHCWRIIFHIKHAQVRPQRTFTSLFYFILLLSLSLFFLSVSLFRCVLRDRKVCYSFSQLFHSHTAICVYVNWTQLFIFNVFVDCFLIHISSIYTKVGILNTSLSSSSCFFFFSFEIGIKSRAVYELLCLCRYNILFILCIW